MINAGEASVFVLWSDSVYSRGTQILAERIDVEFDEFDEQVVTCFEAFDILSLGLVILIGELFVKTGVRCNPGLKGVSWSRVTKLLLRNLHY